VLIIKAPKKTSLRIRATWTVIGQYNVITQSSMLRSRSCGDHLEEVKRRETRLCRDSCFVESIMSWGVQQELISLHLTHVYYNPADPLSFISAHLALVPQALMVIYVTLIYARREIDVLLMFVGQVGSELANYILKHIIREERPQGIYSFNAQKLISRNIRRRIWNAQFTFSVYDLLCRLCYPLSIAQVTRN